MRTREFLDHPAIRLLALPIVTGITLFFIQRVFTATSNVSGTFTFHEVTLPSSLQRELLTLDLALRQERHAGIDATTKLLDDLVATRAPSTSDGQADAFSQKLAKLREGLTRLDVGPMLTTKPDEFRWLGNLSGGSLAELPSSVYVGTITNDGKRTATGVRVEAQNTIYANLSRSGRQPEFLIAKDVVDVGELQPGESIQLVMWSSRLHYYSFDRVVIRHNDGMGSVSLNVPGPKFWAEFPRLLPLVWIFGGGVLAIVIVAILARPRSESAPDPETVAPATP